MVFRVTAKVQDQHGSTIAIKATGQTIHGLLKDTSLPLIVYDDSKQQRDQRYRESYRSIGSTESIDESHTPSKNPPT